MPAPSSLAVDPRSLPAPHKAVASIPCLWPSRKDEPPKTNLAANVVPGAPAGPSGPGTAWPRPAPGAQLGILRLVATAFKGCGCFVVEFRRFSLVSFFRTLRPLRMIGGLLPKDIPARRQCSEQSSRFFGFWLPARFIATLHIQSGGAGSWSVFQHCSCSTNIARRKEVR